MPPRKSAAPPAEPSRRSGRIATRASSRASSVGTEEPRNSALGKGSGKTRTTRNGTRTDTRPPPPPKTATTTTTSPPVAAKHTTTFKKPTKTSRSRASSLASNPAFSLAFAVDRIVRGDRTIISSLTDVQKAAVINGIADRDATLQERIHELEFNNAQLKTERDHAMARSHEQRALRDALFQKRLQKQREADEAAAAASATTSTSNAQTSTPSAQTSTPRVPTTSTPPTRDQHDSTANASEIDFSNTSLITGTPAPAVSIHQTQDTEVTPKARTSLFGSFFKTISSPFVALKKSATPPSTTPQRLGELPASRKRPAPKVEPEQKEQQELPDSQPEPVQTPLSTARTTKQNPVNQRQPASTPTSTSKRSQHATASRQPHTEHALSTILEQSEESNIVAPTPTPSRPPRTLASIRRSATRQAERARTSTPIRAWDRPPMPREPNADRRVEKLRKFNELNKQLKALKDDEELNGMTEPPMKRVKVDDLVAIPHNKPGDVVSTFRVPDIDSDDEMDVDVDEELRANIFEMNSTAASAKESPAKRSPVKAPLPTSQPMGVVDPVQAPVQAPVPAPVEKPKESEPEPERPRMKFDWPNVAPLPPGQECNHNNTYAAAKFAFGYEHWVKTGEVLNLFSSS